MYVKPIEGSPKPAFIKVFETFEEIAMVLLLEDQFHDGEVMEMKQEEGIFEIGLLHESTYFTIKCSNIVSQSMYFSLDNRWVYEISIEKNGDNLLLLVDEQAIRIEAKNIVIEEVIRPERATYTEEELQAIETKAENPEVYVRCPRCGKELHYRAVGNSYEVRCYTEGCIKATSRGI